MHVSQQRHLWDRKSQQLLLLQSRDWRIIFVVKPQCYAQRNIVPLLLDFNTMHRDLDGLIFEKFELPKASQTGPEERFYSVYAYGHISSITRMISSEEIPTCFNCQKPLPYGKSVKKDLPICQSCFDHIYELERLSLRKLSFDDADHILDNIYLGPEGSAIDLPYLQSLNIDRIVAAATYVVIKFPSELEYMHLHLDDSPQEDLMPHFEPVIAFIQKRPESNVLVHCASGISRSASFVIAYVMKTRGLGYQEGWEFVMSKRSIVYPNAGFKQQLIKYENNNCKLILYAPILNCANVIPSEIF